MIAANGATARYLETRGRSAVRRVVVKPKRWDRIVELARGPGTKLPGEPSAKALSAFLVERRAADPTRFADLSLSIVKLLGPGQYMLQRASDPDQGHFGLAVEDYAHSTAPNRRYPDLITQRLLKAAAAGAPAPYSDDELLAIASTAPSARTRRARSSARCARSRPPSCCRRGSATEFDAIVTGASDKGVYVRLIAPPAEGRIVRGEQGLDVGDRVRVKLVETVPAKGFIESGD